MAEMNFEEICPCGNSVKVSGYDSIVRPQIQSWRSIHNKHANTIARAIAEKKKNPPHYIWPELPTASSTPIITFEAEKTGD